MKLTKLLTAATVAAGLAFTAVPALAVTLNLHNGAEPRSLDPQKVSGNWEDRPVSDYIEGLMTIDASGQPILGQAASYEISEDGTVYTFKIRDDANWSDGEPVTAQDFVLGYQRLVDPQTASEYAYLQYVVKNAAEINNGEIEDLDQLGVKAIDDKTLEITLNEPTPFFLDALTHYTAYPNPKHVYDEVGDDWTRLENLVANGPYKVVEWVPGSYLRSEKNDAYYNADNVQIDEVYYHILEDQAAALNRYRAGEFDILTDFPADQIDFLNANYPGEAHVAPFLGVYYYVVNQMDGKILADENLRKALSISINREVIGPDVLGTGELPAYGWVPPGVSNYKGEQYMPAWASEDYADRVEEARQIMADAGYTPDNPLKLQLRYNTNDNHQRIAVAISAMWKPIGVEVELFNSETPVHYDALESGDFTIGRAGWIMDYDDAINMLDLLKTGVGNNYGRYSNAEFDALLDKSATQTDLEARAETLHAAEKIAMDEFGVIPIYYYVSKNVVDPSISGFEDNAKDRHLVMYMSKSE
ncbi:peptide ABC transporter substrate-binding protein [Cucumibacter marinus]|uniref:peptide ABC transporter substrate-binding protein n=1 Tax=Cucumibacter marinus TaxID=1121252 RepID=UPI0003F75AED|nr:peptide ABC transporter substrate-binding protein [Cucumibacter marinus]